MCKNNFKHCSGCNTSKSLSEFYRSKATKDGLQNKCKKCQSDRKEYLKEYRARNSEKLKKLNKQWYSENIDKCKQKFKDYYLENITILRQKGQQHYQNNKSLYLHYSKSRKLLLTSRLPLWNTEKDLDDIKMVYCEARRLTLETGVQYHVDHIIPLQGVVVCGLHVPSNLQIITAEEKLKKSNSYEVC